MTRIFTPRETANSDRYFRYLEATAECAGVGTRSREGFNLYVGSAFRSARGNIATKAGFPAEETVNLDFMRKLARQPILQYPLRGIQVRRSDTGLFIGSSTYNFNRDTGDATYTYSAHIAKPNSEPDLVACGSVVGRVVMEGNLLAPFQDSIETTCPAEVFFHDRVPFDNFRASVWATVLSQIQ